MYCQLIVFFIVASLAPSLAVIRYPGRHRSRSNLIVCALPSKPCRSKTTMADFNGNEISSTENEICSCPYPNTCSSDWTDSQRAIKHTLFSTSYNITLNMMYCGQVQPREFCELGQTALIVSGPMAIPQDIVSYNCRCEPGSPLLMRQRRVGRDHLMYGSFVCEYHMPTCSYRVSPCITLDENVANYNCKCTRGRVCRIENNVYLGTPNSGYCAA